MSKSALLLAAALVAAPVFAQDNAAADPVILAGGGISIHRSEFEGAMKSLPPQYQDYAMGPGKRAFAEDFLRMKLLAAAGTQAGLENDPEVLRQLQTMRENLMASAQLRKIEQTVTVSDDDLRRTYEAKKGELERAKARHILVAFTGSPAAQPGKPELTEEQAKARAEELRAKVESGAAKFEDLAKTDSDDVGSGENGGFLGEFGRGQMVPEFELAAFTTEVGKLSPVVRTQYGFHFLKVESRGVMPFEEAKPNLERAERNARVQAEIARIMQAAQPKFEESYFGAAAPAPAAK